MRIKACFEMPHVARARDAGRVLSGLSALLLLLTALLVVDSLQLKEKSSASSLRIKVLQSEMGDGAIELPSLAKLKDLSAKVEQMNRLAEGYVGNISKVLYHFEQIIPDQVYLASLSYKQKSSELIVTATASESGTLSAFAKSLEEHPDVEEVIYAKQLRGQKKGEASSVEIRLRLSR